MFDYIYKLIESKKRFVILAIVKTVRSTPRKSGTKMIIHKDGSVKRTIGGGKIEAEIIKVRYEK